MSRRVVAAVFALIAFAIASYMAAYQLRLIGSVWDPLSGDPTPRVLRFFGFPDAALGAVAYLLEALLLFAGRERLARWLALALALGGVGLVALQLFVIHAVCVLCVISAAISCVIFLLMFARQTPRG